jgi:choline monooxygenase
VHAWSGVAPECDWRKEKMAMASSVRIDSALASDLENGATLPADWYSSPAIFAAERENIFRRSWQYVGHIGQVQNPGDFFTARMGDVPIVVTRDDRGTVRAMANVCRHRGSEVVLDCAGNRKTLQCHYHGWTYNLDGSLRAAPRANEQVSFAKGKLSLVPFAIETWGPMLFVNPDSNAAPFREVIGDLPALFERAGVEVDRLRLARRDVYEMASNWKTIIENFNECYTVRLRIQDFRRSLTPTRTDRTPRTNTIRPITDLSSAPMVPALTTRPCGLP